MVPRQASPTQHQEPAPDPDLHEEEQLEQRRRRSLSVALERAGRLVFRVGAMPDLTRQEPDRRRSPSQARELLVERVKQDRRQERPSLSQAETDAGYWGGEFQEASRRPA